MNCLKCGRETLAEQVFCPDCQAEMEKYPVKPGTVVLLPRRKENAAPKKALRRIPLEDQVQTLRSWARWLAIGLILSLILNGLLAYPAFEYLTEDRVKIGQNYTAIVPTEVPEPTNN